MYIYINYIGEYNEVKQIKAQFQKDIIQHEVAKKTLYEKNNSNVDMFNKKSNVKQPNGNTVNPEKFEQEVSLMDSKQDKWYSKIVSFFKNIFK